MTRTQTGNGPLPFTIAVPQSVLDDLRGRLERVRWPDTAPGEEWQYGASAAYLKSMLEYWHSGYDWRAQEAGLNRLHHYTVELDGIPLHFIHEPGAGPKPMPLLISHGWPGSIVEFQQIIPMLCDPASHGADPNDAFTVIAPSLPGYGFSFRPNQPRFGPAEMAETLHTLMSKVLGYERFCAQGGDWGAWVTTRLAYRYPGSLHGIHLNLLPLWRDFTAADARTEEEHAYIRDLNSWLEEETGYQAIMGTKPQTLAYGLTDSPAGLAAWILEKFRAWSDCGGDLDGYFSRDDLLTNIMLYWVTGAINSSSWPYYARRHTEWIVPKGEQVRVPSGYASFPKEMLHPPRSLAERMFADLRRWEVMPRGGHFAALEQPQLLAEEIRAFFRPFR